MKCNNPFVKEISKGDPFASPPIPPRYVAFPCGKCIACRINKKREWVLRLNHEVAYQPSAHFVTLTYSDEHLPINPDTGLNCPSVRDLQLFIKRLRKQYPDCKIRYMINSEYGETTKRVHYHGIIFGLPTSITEDAQRIVRDGHVSFHSLPFESIWSLGNAELAEVCPERVAYICQYFVDKCVVEGYDPSVSVMSRGYGIGRDFIEDAKERMRFYQLRSLPSYTGNPVAVPRYYKHKVYTDDERQKQFSDYVDKFSFSAQDLIMLDNSKYVESIRKKVIMFNNKKHKL